MSYTREEVRFLAAHLDQIAAVAAPLALNKHTLVQDMGVLRDRFGDHARAVAELVHARRASQAKLPDDALRYWLSCQDSAQQATPLVVAELRARRIAAVCGQGALVADVTCSVGTEGLAVAGEGLGYVGSDVDFSRLDMAAHNLQATGAGLFVADALVPAVRSGAVGCVVADPARRSAGRRLSDPSQLLPPLPSLLDAWSGVPMAVKCAPGIDYSGWRGVVSVVSVDGGVKETCLYTPEFGAGRQAIVVRGGGVDTLEDTLDDHAGQDLSGPVGRFIVDPDGAIVRAGLVRHFAVREGLWMLDERIAYITGERIPSGYSGFEVIEQVPLKKLKAALKRLDCGSVEVLVRGVDVEPDRLRTQLKLRGSRPLAVVITRIGVSAVALVCGPRQFRGSFA